MYCQRWITSGFFYFYIYSLYRVSAGRLVSSRLIVVQPLHVSSSIRSRKSIFPIFAMASTSSNWQTLSGREADSHLSATTSWIQPLSIESEALICALVELSPRSLLPAWQPRQFERMRIVWQLNEIWSDAENLRRIQCALLTAGCQVAFTGIDSACGRIKRLRLFARGKGLAASQWLTTHCVLLKQLLFCTVRQPAIFLSYVHSNIHFWSTNR